MFIFLATIFFGCGASAGINVSSIPDGVPILYNKLAKAHISYDTFRIIYAVDLTEYYHIERQIGFAIEGLKNRCPANKGSYSYCETSTLQLENRLKASTYDDEILAGYRVKRFCEWCGNFLHYSTGVVDADTAKIWTKFMNEVKNETSRQTVEIFNQTAIFKTYMEADIKTTENTQRALNRLQISLNEVSEHEEKEIEDIHDRLIDQELFQLADATLTEHERMYRKLRATMVNTKRGRIPELIVKKKLAKQLNDIALSLPAEQRLPIETNEENPLHIFSFAELSAALFKDHLLITILIPIAERERYNLYKVTAIPVKTDGQRFITKINSEHFLLNSDKTKFIPISRHELDNGKMRSPREILYRPAASIITNSQIICEWRVLMEMEMEPAKEGNACEFTPLLTNEMLISVIVNKQYFVSSPKGIKIKETCAHTENKYTIGDRSLIQMDAGCTIKTANFVLRAHRIHTLNDSYTIMPEMLSAGLLSKKLPQLATATYSKLIMNDSTPIVIHDAAEMNNMIKRTEELLRETDHEFKLKDLEYSANGWSIGFISAISVISMVVAIGAFLMFKKFNVLSLALNALGTANDQVPHQIRSLAPEIINNWINAVPPIATAPQPPQTMRHETIEMPESNKAAAQVI